MPTGREVLGELARRVPALEKRIDKQDEKLDAILAAVQAKPADDFMDAEFDLGGESTAAQEPSGQSRPLASQVEPEDDIVVEDDEGNTAEVNFGNPTEQQRAFRRVLAEQIGWEHWTYNEQSDVQPLPEDEAKHYFEEGGALWLYFFDRVFVMQQRVDTRRKMIEDASTVSARHAGEMARDILMERGDDESRAVIGAAADNLLSVTAARKAAQGRG